MSLLIIGTVLFLGAIADPTGNPHTPGSGAAILMAVVVVIASLPAYGDPSSGKRRRKYSAAIRSALN